MRLHAIGPIAALTLAAGACDPVFSMNVRQSLHPSPSQDCLAGALAGSPRVVEATKRGRKVEDGFHVTVRDTLAPGDAWHGIVTRQAAAAGSGERVSVTYSWMGYASPGREHRALMRAAAEALLADIRAACAPSQPPSPPECVMTGALLPETPCRTTA